MRLIDADKLKVDIESFFADGIHIHDSFIELIDEQPTIEPERKHSDWTPCSEGLPDESDYIGCAECIDGAVWYYTDKYAMGLGYYYESTKSWATIDDTAPYGNVIAWMPLPEPYAERRQDDIRRSYFTL